MATPKPDDPVGAMDSEWTRSSERRGAPRASAKRGSVTREGGDESRASHGLSLKGRALALLARREHSRVELRSKLAAHAESAENLERMLDELAARGFLSDARVVDSIVHQRAARLGSARIRMELDRKGIAPELSVPALAALRDSEHDRAWVLWQSKFGLRSPSPAAGPRKANLDPHESADERTASSAERRETQALARLTQQRERARQQRFLLSRGFSAATVNDTLRRAGLANADNENHNDGDGDENNCFSE